jgi:hypothetical protein
MDAADFGYLQNRDVDVVRAMEEFSVRTYVTFHTIIKKNNSMKLPQQSIKENCV